MPQVEEEVIKERNHVISQSVVKLRNKPSATADVMSTADLSTSTYEPVAVNKVNSALLNKTEETEGEIRHFFM